MRFLDGTEELARLGRFRDRRPAGTPGHINGPAARVRALGRRRADSLGGLYERALEALAEAAEANGEMRAAVEWWAAAIRHGLAHVAGLHRDLDPDPDVELVNMISELRRGTPATCGARVLQIRNKIL